MPGAKGYFRKMNCAISTKITGLPSKICKFYKIFLPAVFKSCRFYMAELILFIPKNACLHPVIHSKLVAD